MYISSQHTVKTTEYRIHNTETHVHKITNVLFLFFYMVLGHNDFDVGKSITRAIGMGGP